MLIRCCRSSGIRTSSRCLLSHRETKPPNHSRRRKARVPRVCSNRPFEPHRPRILWGLPATGDTTPDNLEPSSFPNRASNGCKAVRLNPILEIIDDVIKCASGEPINDGQTAVACNHAMVGVPRYENRNTLRDPKRHAIGKHGPFTRQTKIELGGIVPMHVEGSMRRKVSDP